MTRLSSLSRNYSLSFHFQLHVNSLLFEQFSLRERPVHRFRWWLYWHWITLFSLQSSWTSVTLKHMKNQKCCSTKAWHNNRNYAKKHLQISVYSHITAIPKQIIDFWLYFTNRTSIDVNTDCYKNPGPKSTKYSHRSSLFLFIMR